MLRFLNASTDLLPKGYPAAIRRTNNSSSSEQREHTGRGQHEVNILRSQSRHAGSAGS